MSDTHIITRQLVAEEQRTNVTANLFGVYFPLQLEPLPAVGGGGREERCRF